MSKNSKVTTLQPKTISLQSGTKKRGEYLFGTVEIGPFVDNSQNQEILDHWSEFAHKTIEKAQENEFGIKSAKN